jgi:hypothetical protein
MQKDERIDPSACTLNTFPKGADLIVAMATASDPDARRDDDVYSAACLDSFKYA